MKKEQGVFLPRGIRNNNPGNIRLSSAPWQGRRASQSDTDFVEFTDPMHGLRALMKILLTYQLKYELDTVDSIINRFAPPHENDTASYSLHVARILCVGRTKTINLLDKPALAAIARAIVLHENGKAPPGRPEAWYAPDIYNRAADLALSSIV